jgi:hypothetical protein
VHGLDQCWAVVSTSVGQFSLFYKEFSVSVFGAGFTNHHSFQNFRKNSIRWFSALVVLRDGFHKSFSQIMVFSFIKAFFCENIYSIIYIAFSFGFFVFPFLQSVFFVAIDVNWALARVLFGPLNDAKL